MRPGSEVRKSNWDCQKAGKEAQFFLSIELNRIFFKQAQATGSSTAFHDALRVEHLRAAEVRMWQHP